MFTFPSALTQLWGGALILLSGPPGTGLLFAHPDYDSTPLQISLDYVESFHRSGFAAQFLQPAGKTQIDVALLSLIAPNSALSYSGCSDCFR